MHWATDKLARVLIMRPREGPKQSLKLLGGRGSWLHLSHKGCASRTRCARATGVRRSWVTPGWHVVCGLHPWVTTRPLSPLGTHCCTRPSPADMWAAPGHALRVWAPYGYTFQCSGASVCTSCPYFSLFVSHTIFFPLTKKCFTIQKIQTQ